jgi:branched-chain amino acid transport system ATP-binding protein
MTQLGIGRSFQRTTIFKSLTVFENVRLAAQAVMTRAGRLLRSAQGEDRQGSSSARTIRAARQLEITLTLASGAKILLLDEPLAGMGSEESERVMRLLKDFGANHAILLIEHDMDFVFAVAEQMT